MLSRRLRRRGYEVLIATDGQQGVEDAKKERPQLILMDMSLPVLDGWEATRQIRADSEIGDTRIIALTAHAMAGDREKAISAGCDDYHTKPVDLEQLVQQIETLLNGPGGP
ncbi:response regulator [Alienimonas californiensis]